MSETPAPSWLKRFWRERVLMVIVAQFKQGITPQKIALSFALGFNFGIFPLMGTATLLCVIFGVVLKLNQPLIQLANTLTIPLQAPLVLVFVRIGETILRAPHVSFSIPELIRKFHASPLNFLHEFGLTGLHGVLAWLIIAPFTTALIFLLVLFPVKKLYVALALSKLNQSYNAP